MEAAVVAVNPDGSPLRMHGRRVGLEVTKLLLLFGIQQPFTISLFWRLVKTAILFRHRLWVAKLGVNRGFYVKRLPVLLSALLVSATPAIAWERFDRDEGYKNCVDLALREWLEQGKWRSLSRVEKSAYKSLAHQRCSSPVQQRHLSEIVK